MDDDVRTAVARLVAEEGEAFYGDADRVEARLRQAAGDHAAEVAAVVVAARAGAVDQLQGIKPGLYDISVGHLTSRIVRVYGLDAEAAHWAVEAWAEALGAHASSESTTAPRPVLHDENGQERSSVSPAPRLPWPWVIGVGLGVVGVIALGVLVRLVAGLVSAGSADESTGRPVAPSTSASLVTPEPTTVVPTTATPTTATPTTAAASALAVPPGLTLGTGDVQITVLWADGNDLDLHVIDPTGAEIYFSHPKSPSGGTLDHDDTAGCSTRGTHVENVFWPTGSAPPGRYQVFVKNYGSCGAPSTYALRALVGGRQVVTVSGSIPAAVGSQSPTSSFTR